MVLQPQPVGSVAQGRVVRQLHEGAVRRHGLRRRHAPPQGRAGGPICHTGNPTCFFTSVDSLPKFEAPETGPGILEELFATVQDRKRERPEGSYTARLLEEGVARISQKVIEEAGELGIAGVKGNRSEVVAEAADVLYHTLVLLAASGARPEDVWEELRKRRR